MAILHDWGYHQLAPGLCQRVDYDVNDEKYAFSLLFGNSIYDVQVPR